MDFNNVLGWQDEEVTRHMVFYCKAACYKPFVSLSMSIKILSLYSSMWNFAFMTILKNAAGKIPRK